MITDVPYPYQHFYDYLATNVINPFYEDRSKKPNELRLARVLRKRKILSKSRCDRSRQTYYKYAGKDFWSFISLDDNLYRKIIVPIDEEAKLKDEAFKTAYTAKINEMTQDFMNQFMTNNLIDWIKLVDYVSQRD